MEFIFRSPAERYHAGKAMSVLQKRWGPVSLLDLILIVVIVCALAGIVWMVIAMSSV
jgi:hypothetical protein